MLTTTAAPSDAKTLAIHDHAIKLFDSAASVTLTRVTDECAAFTKVDLWLELANVDSSRE